jgi:thioredoxin reductase (NADPH)
MSHYLIEALRAKPNIDVLLNAEVVTPPRGRPADRHRDPRQAQLHGHAPRLRRTVRLHRRPAETAWLPAEIARDANGYILTGRRRRARRPLVRQRDPYLLESSVPGIFACGTTAQPRSSASPAAVGESSMAIALIHSTSATRSAT